MSTNYPGVTITPVLGLDLTSIDAIVAQDFILIDNFAGLGSSVKVNGATVLSPNFNSILPAAPGGDSNVIFQVDSLGNVSAYYNSTNSDTLAGLADVLLTSPTDGQVLTYHASTGLWINATPGGGGSSAWSALTGTLSNGQVIPYGDAGISRLGPAHLALGDGTAGNDDGTLSLTTLDLEGDLFDFFGSSGTARQVLMSVGSVAGVEWQYLKASDIPTGLNITTAASTSAPSPLFSPSETPASTNPYIYVQDVNGNWHVQAVVDTTTANSAGSGPADPAGTLTWTRRMYFRDSLASTQGGKNAFLSVNHVPGVGTLGTNQDRALWISMQSTSASISSFSITGNVVTFNISMGTNPGHFYPGQTVSASGMTTGTYLNGVTLTLSTVTVIGGGPGYVLTAPFTHIDTIGTIGDTGAIDMVMYSMECLQMEQDVYGTPTFVAAVDSELRTLSLQFSDNVAAAGAAAPNLGVGCIRANYFRAVGAGNWGSQSPDNARFIVQNNSSVDGGFAFLTNINIQGADSAACPHLSYIALRLEAPSPRFAQTNWGLYINDWGTHANDLAINVVGGVSFFGGDVQLGTKVTEYNSISTVSNGVPAEYATVDVTGNAASIGTTTLYAVPSTGAAMYRISYYMKITTAGSSSGSVTLTLVYNDRDDSVPITITVPTPANATDSTSVVSGTLIVDAALSTNITYATSYSSSGGTAMVYKLRLKAEVL